MFEDFSRDEGLRHLERGLALERSNRIAEAVEEYRLAIARYPYLREAHAALGYYYQRRGLLAKAADEFHIVANLDGDFLAYFNLAYVLLELEHYDDALVAFSTCLQFEPDDPATHYKIATIHVARDEFLTALHYLQAPLHSYPNDWEILNLMGKCYLSLHRYDEALSVFTQALQIVHTPEAQVELLDSIQTVERYREFRSFKSTKDMLYAQEGIVFLGSAQDNGLSVTEVQDYHFTYPDIGITLQRFIALQRGQRWHFTTVVPVDKAAQPLAAALADVLRLPYRPITDLVHEDTALLVIATAREVELLLLAIEHAPCTTITFCLGLNWLRHSRFLPDIVGMVAHGACSVPWESELRRLRSDGVHPAQIDACLASATHQTLQAIHETPPDANLTRQVRYYTCQHRRLSFPLTP